MFDAVRAFDLENFRRTGFQVVEGVVPDAAVARIRDFLESELDGALEGIARRFPHDGPADLVRRIQAGLAAGTLPSGEATLDQMLSGHFPLATRLSEELWAVPKSAPLRAVLERLFPGERLRMHMPPAARFVLPGNDGAGVPAHQDVSYNRHMSDFVTVWVPFTPIDEACGGVAVDPGGPSREAATEAEGFWLKSTLAAAELVPCPVPLGGVLILSPRLVHRSMPNRSDRCRLSIDYRFFGSASRSTKHYLDLDDYVVFDGDGKLAS